MQRNELVNLANTLGFDASTIPNDSKLEGHLKYLQANQATVAGTLATGVLTSSGVAVNTQTITIGDIVYTTVASLTGAKATSTFTVSGQPEEGEMVQIDGVTYTFRAVPVSPYDVDIGGSAAASLDNLQAAINAGAGAGTAYGTGTEAHPTCTAEANAATTQEVTAKNNGVYGNRILVSTTVADGAWDAATLEGGVDNVPFEVLMGVNAAATLDNLKSAIDGTAGAGTTYSLGTYAHPQVTATTNTDTAQTVQARDMAVTNARIATTETQTNWAWGAATLTGGVADQNAIDAVAVAGTGSGQNANV